jgi:hypothetical protein
VTDLSILLSDYNSSDPTKITQADINGDGTVDILDLSILLSHYGESVSASFSTNLTQGMTITPPFTWTFDPGVPTTAGYFFADGVQLAKITGPGPYSFTIQSSTLTAGAHTLGGSWDLASDGTHVRFPQAYSVTIAGPTGGGGGGPGIGYSGPWRDTSYTMPASFTKVITTASAFKSLVSAGGSLVAGDVVHVVGPMNIDGCSTDSCHTVINKFLSSPASIYFDSNVIFKGDTRTTAGGFSSVYIDGSNINLYGGQIAGGQASGGLNVGPAFSNDTKGTSNIRWWGLKIHDVGGGGVLAGGEKNSAGVWLGSSNLDLDVETWNVGMQPQNDPHCNNNGVCGTGIHAIYIGSSPSDPPGAVLVNNSKFSVYSHDTTQCLGDAQVGQSVQNSEFWIRAENLSFINSSRGAWTAARAFTPWTQTVNSYTDQNITVHDVEAHNVIGPVVFTEALGSGPVTVEYGRGLNVLQTSQVQSYYNNNPYQPNSHITYQNVQ